MSLFTHIPLNFSGYLCLGLSLTLTAQAAPVTDKPSFPTLVYWDNWTDQKGISHLTQCRITAFHPLITNNAPTKSGNNHEIITHQAMIWDGVKQDKKGYATVTTIVQPPGWHGRWENTQHAQWVIPVAGTYFVETMDRTRIELNPGDILLNEDIGSIRDKNGRQGHLSGNVGNAAVALVNTQFNTLDHPAHKPCVPK